MKDVCADLLEEYNELAALAEKLTPEQWHAKTAFFGWTPWDEIAHLCFFDETGLLAATDADAFAANTRALMTELGKGREISAITREKYGAMDGTRLLVYWRTRFEALSNALARLDSKARLPWYGPTMSARSFATARMMETWAHGQDVFDIVRVPRQPSRRLKHIAHIGATTYGWTFVNRKLPVPEPAPYIELSAPGNETWTWNEPAADNAVRGKAEEFCLVVTQRRNIADTQLQVTGVPATYWMSIAQCFAGPPATPPDPGVRVVQYDDAASISG
ncbi:TIGR03084 family metal-binding protein [Noviherbaspirillum saxi]|uniref:TIGR03084 family protein n=1 Tax=Noviherbaspirillum saxi TaxID=2320863 RepID=A0A3A3FLV1_9BURK|nr:TIGR03084 family metal-binding protein [Noviherbaspirillum saxi]RJF95455.1 TIGR03084 family protein [Noviherbaspirillum saxi]